MSMTIYQAADLLYQNAKDGGRGISWPTDILEKDFGLEQCVKQKIATKRDENAPDGKYRVYKMTDETLKSMDESRPRKEAMERLYSDEALDKGIKVPINSPDSLYCP